MKLDQNSNQGKKGKYALILLRNVAGRLREIDDDYIVPKDVVQFGASLDDEFFVIKLKDRHSKAALEAYARSVKSNDVEYAAEVQELADRSGPHHLLCKEPD
jgi:hypothetical protein